MKSLKTFLLPLFFMLLIIGCAGSDSPVIPDQSEKNTSLPVENILSSDRHTLLGKWDLNFLLEEQLVIVSEYRDSETHYNVTTVIPTPEIIINSYDPLTNIIDVDVTISNPYTIDVYDVRLIIFTDASGHLLQNDDGWTPLYDIPGGLPVNPFRAYAKIVPERKFAGQTEHAENLLILLPGGNPNVTFAIDASYPGNCEEPYKFGSLSQEILYDEIGAAAILQVGVFDHQNNVNSVNLYCPEITNTDLVPFTYIGFGGWELELINNMGADPGEYEGWLVASSSDSGGLALYKPVDIVVSRLTTGWAQSISEDRNNGECIYFDGDKNLYITGQFHIETDFDPGRDEDFHYSEGSYDIYLTKYDYDGNFEWARTWGGEPCCSEAGYGVTTDMNGDVFVTGHFIGEPDFDPGPDETIVASNGHKDIFLSKFDPDGNFLWVLTWGGSESPPYNS